MIEYVNNSLFSPHVLALFFELLKFSIFRLIDELVLVSVINDVVPIPYINTFINITFIYTIFLTTIY